MGSRPWPASSSKLELPHLELDSIFHQAGWTQLPEDYLRRRVRRYLDTHESWVIDGNYAPVRDLDWAEGTDVVWLHPPRWRMMRQIIGRSISRTVTREEVWSGSCEPWGSLTSLNPERSIIAWAFTQRQADPRWAHARHHKFLSHQAAQQWLQTRAG